MRRARFSALLCELLGISGNLLGLILKRPLAHLFCEEDISETQSKLFVESFCQASGLKDPLPPLRGLALLDSCPIRVKVEGGCSPIFRNHLVLNLNNNN